VHSIGDASERLYNLFSTGRMTLSPKQVRARRPNSAMAICLMG